MLPLKFGVITWAATAELFGSLFRRWKTDLLAPRTTPTVRAPVDKKKIPQSRALHPSGGGEDPRQAPAAGGAQDSGQARALGHREDPVQVCLPRAAPARLRELRPNILASPPPPASKAPLTASARKKRSTPAPAPPLPAPQRRFLVARKGAHRRRHINDGASAGAEFDFDKCREAAREALRASHEEFYLKERAASAATDEEEQSKKEEEEKATEQEADSGAFEEAEEGDVAGLEGSSKVRAIRSRVMAKALNTVPDSGAGRVKHLVDAFESLLSISGDTADAERAGEEAWALPGLQPWKEGGEAVFSSSDFMNLGPSRQCNSLDVKSNRPSWDSQTGGRRSRRNSSESLRSSWNKKLKVTSQHPFKLRTEQRGRAKEQQFFQKVQEMLIEDEQKRIHIAQGLPWTTDEPEVCHFPEPNFLDHTPPLAFAQYMRRKINLF